MLDIFVNFRFDGRKIKRLKSYGWLIADFKLIEATRTLFWDKVDKMCDLFLGYQLTHMGLVTFLSTLFLSAFLSSSFLRLLVWSISRRRL